MFSQYKMIVPPVVAALLIGILIAVPTPGSFVHARPNGLVEPSENPVPIRIISGHVYVDVEINGKGPFHFLFDTGASNILTPAAANRLGLAVRNNVEATGTGGMQAGGSTTVKSVRLGSTTLPDQTFYVLDLPAGTSDDAPVDGLIGYEWLDRYPARLDYAGTTLTFFTAKGARYIPSAAPARLSFRGRTPQIDAKVDGIAGRFTIDTGSASSLTLSAPFVADHNLAERYHAGTRVMSARGIGGPVYALLARAELFDLGPANVARPVTFLSQQRAGTSARNDTAGNIGFGILQQFTIIFDYPRKQIYFEPNANWGKADLVDRSGLRIERSAAAFSIAFVVDGSPAAMAGLKTGDRILAVGEVPSARLAVDDVRRLLKGPVGTRVLLTLDHGPTVVVLADL